MMVSERGGWNPAVDEAIIVPLTWLGAVLLPAAGWRLSKGVGRGIGCAAVALTVVAAIAIGFWNVSLARLTIEREKAKAAARLQEAAQEASLRQSQSPATNGATFGPVLERTLPMSELGYSYSLNLESDLLQSMPANLTQADWSSGITLPDGIIIVAASEGRPVMIAGTSTQVEPVRNGVVTWDSRRANDIRISYELEKGQTVTVSGETDSLPLTFAFRTQNGTSGLLQITGYTDNPRGVKIRYKLVQNKAVPSERKVERTESASDEFPPGSLWLSGLGFPQVLDVYADLTQCELSIEPRVRELTAKIGYTNTTALKRNDVIAQLERALRDQAGVIVKHKGANRIAVRYGGLEFRWVAAEVDTNSPTEWLPDASDATGERQLRVSEEVLLDESAVARADFTVNQPEQKAISVGLTESGTERLAELTTAHVGRQLAVVWRGRVLMSLKITTPITGGTFNLTARLTDAEAQHLLDALNHRSVAKPKPQATPPPPLRSGFNQGDVTDVDVVSARLTALRASLTERLLHVTEYHPDVVRLRQQIESLEAQQRKLEMKKDRP
jgi:hypothetical protein